MDSLGQLTFFCEYIYFYNGSPYLGRCCSNQLQRTSKAWTRQDAINNSNIYFTNTEAIKAKTQIAACLEGEGRQSTWEVTWS